MLYHLAGEIKKKPADGKSEDSQSYFAKERIFWNGSFSPGKNNDEYEQVEYNRPSCFFDKNLLFCRGSI
ncbi:MAG: hypothetical protein JXA41_10375 [Deltaproteobacteria bacterium]|nr:hypothetical protein [Deltaproteobacteria bacterium]